MRSGLVMLLTVAVACSNPVSSASDIRVETSLSAPYVRPEEPVTVTVVVTNRGDRTREVMDGSGFCPAPFTATATDGTVVRPSVLCTAIARPPEKLAPGKSLSFTAVWSGRHTLWTSTPEPNELPTGSYQERGTVAVIGVGEVVSPPVELLILP